MPTLCVASDNVFKKRHHFLAVYWLSKEDKLDARMTV